MKAIFGSFPIALNVIFKDPINLLLAAIPTVLALAIYFLGIFSIYWNSDLLVSFFKGYIYTADQATLLARVLTVILIVFVFVLMSWTFVLVVSVISAPFNSLLSERIEKKLVLHQDPGGKAKIMKEISVGIGQTFKNEFKKIFFLGLMALMAFVLNLFPLFYPVGMFIVATLLAVQFVDYSWSRHNLNFSACMKDLTGNIIPYSVAGFIFLLLVTVPIINAFVPALATSYFTVLWINRQHKNEASLLPKS